MDVIERLVPGLKLFAELPAVIAEIWEDGRYIFALLEDGRLFRVDHRGRTREVKED